MNIVWKIKTFAELNSLQLYNIMQLRSEVFVVEQNCVYQDADGKDTKSLHLMGTNDNNELIAYSRIVPPGVSFKEVSIGRVVTSPKVRRTGAGKQLMKHSLEKIKEIYGNVPVRIGAQCYLKQFYTDLGFNAEGEEFLEDNIPHIEMVFNPSN